MWAQQMKVHLKPGTQDRVPEVLAHLRAAEQPNSGLLRTTVLFDQDDPTVLYTFVLFESEEQARARENDPRRTDELTAARAVLGEIVAGPPEFTNLVVFEETTPA